MVLITACLAYKEYQRNVRTQRAQWLLSLFERFYETDRYRDARRPGYHIIKDEDDQEGRQKWADYLNFFEFIAYLERDGHLRHRDVEAMFDYWLKQLDLPEIREQLLSEGFENLEAYFVSLEHSG